MAESRYDQYELPLTCPRCGHETKPRLFMGHVDKGFQPGVFVRSESGFS